MNEGIVEGCEDSSNAKDELTLSDLRAQGDILLLWADGTFLGRHLVSGYLVRWSISEEGAVWSLYVKSRSSQQIMRDTRLLITYRNLGDAILQLPVRTDTEQVFISTYQFSPHPTSSLDL